MPLYNYVVTYGTGSCVAQGRHSNFKGFASTWTNIPADALPSLKKGDRQKLAERAYWAPFNEVPSRKGVWKQMIAMEEGPVVVYAIQTDA